MGNLIILGFAVCCVLLDGCHPRKGYPKPDDWEPEVREKHIPSRCIYRFKRREMEEEKELFYMWVGGLFEEAFMFSPVIKAELILYDYLLEFFNLLFQKAPLCRTVFETDPVVEKVAIPSESTESLKQMISACFADPDASCKDSYVMHMHEPDIMSRDINLFYNVRTAYIFLSHEGPVIKLLRVEVISLASGSNAEFICPLFVNENPLSNDAWDVDADNDTGMNMAGDDTPFYGQEYNFATQPDVFKFLNFCVEHVYKSIAVRIVEAYGVKEATAVDGAISEPQYTIGPGYVLHVPHN